MIFFTLGTERYGFPRLVQAAEMTASRFPDEEIFVQLGHHTEPPAGCRWERFIPFDELRDTLRSARVVVSHAGAGTILTCNALGRVPIVMPREHRRGEHLDNHQDQLARRMSELERIIVTRTPEEILDAILKYDTPSTHTKTNPAETPELARSISYYLEAVEHQPGGRVPADWNPRTEGAFSKRRNVR